LLPPLPVTQVDLVRDGGARRLAVAVELRDARVADEVLVAGRGVSGGEDPLEGDGLADGRCRPALVGVVEHGESGIAAAATLEPLGSFDALRLVLDRAAVLDASRRAHGLPAR